MAIYKLFSCSAFQQLQFSYGIFIFIINAEAVIYSSPPKPKGSSIGGALSHWEETPAVTEFRRTTVLLTWV